MVDNGMREDSPPEMLIMTTTLLWILIVLAGADLVMTFVLLVRGRPSAQGDLQRVLQAELRIAREESSNHARGLREDGRDIRLVMIGRSVRTRLR